MTIVVTDGRSLGDHFDRSRTFHVASSSLDIIHVKPCLPSRMVWHDDSNRDRPWHTFSNHKHWTENGRERTICASSMKLLLKTCFCNYCEGLCCPACASFSCFAIALANALGRRKAGSSWACVAYIWCWRKCTGISLCGVSGMTFSNPYIWSWASIHIIQVQCRELTILSNTQAFSLRSALRHCHNWWLLFSKHCQWFRNWSKQWALTSASLL